MCLETRSWQLCVKVWKCLSYKYLPDLPAPATYLLTPFNTLGNIGPESQAFANPVVSLLLLIKETKLTSLMNLLKI